jgi:hypothetical protein
MLIWLAIILLLAAVAWQDFRYRAVYTWLFPTLAALTIGQALWLGVFSFAILFANILIVILQLALLNVAMCWRTRSSRWLMSGEHWIGWGDVAFFGVVACSFSTLNFVFFFVGSLLLVLLATIGVRIANKRVTDIPLAGWQAALLGMLLLWDAGAWGRSFYKDLHIASAMLGV